MRCDKKDLLLYAVTDRSWLGGETPVSYTHLDVYKRQAYAR